MSSSYGIISTDMDKYVTVGYIYPLDIYLTQEEDIPRSDVWLYERMDKNTTPHQLTPLNCKHRIQFMKNKERKKMCFKTRKKLSFG